ncbi:MAG: hypothetical protein JWL71_2287 [Acidobacteria bacterium]|nr:hypothetical protein [Acidobacteriota bacterium]
MMRFRTPYWGALCASVFLTATTAGADTIAVPAGGDLQAALNAARAGDVITLAAGATYVGNFVLPNKGPINDFITIRSAAPDAALPPAGVRITPANALLLPKIRSSNSAAALRTAAATNHWKLLLLEFGGNQGGYGDVIALGAGDATQTQLSQVPYALILDRIYLHGDPIVGQKRGISLHSSDTTIVNSYVSECKAVGQDSQALSGFNGPGNYLIENNYFEGATENVLFGGADPVIPNLVTSNITFRRNYLSKPLAWKDPIIATPAAVSATLVRGSGSLAPGTYFYKVAARVGAGQTNKANSLVSAEVSATVAAGTTGGVTISWTPVVGAEDYMVYGRTAGTENMYWKTTSPFFTDNGAAGTAGTPVKATKWAVKNIFELKNAQDVLVEGNVFENIWVADQTGYPIVFTPRNQGGKAPWAVVQRITFQYNLIRHAAGGVNILGTDDLAPSLRTNNIIVRHNVMDDLTAATWGAGSRPVTLGAGPDLVTIDHNTIISTSPQVVWLYGGSVTAPVAITNATITNNVAAHNTYGVGGSGFGFGLTAINAYLPGVVFSRNLLAGGSASRYPAGSFFPAMTAWLAGFVDYAAGDYRLSAASPYRNAATDGTDLGADIGRLNAAVANALSGDDRIPPGEGHLQIVTTALADGLLNQYYAQSLVCTGASTPCAWQLVDSTLPAGVTFDATAGAVLGMPTRIETGSLTVSAYNPAWPANVATVTLSLTIAPPPFTVSIPGAPAAQVGVSYQLTPSVTGTLGSSSWSLVSGTLPAGLTLDPFSGAVTGTPQSWGTSTAVIQAQDSWRIDRIDAKAVTITVAPAALRVTTPSLGSIEYRQGYQAQLAVSGGTGSTTWTVIGGALPAGVTLDASGGVSGTPTAIGTFSVTVRAVDANWPGSSADAPLALVVSAPVMGMTVSAPSSAQIGVPYAGNGAATGIVGTASWSIATGALPAGIALNAATGEIAGVPAAFGGFTVVVQVQDSYDASRVLAAALSIIVAPRPIAITTTSVPAANAGSAFAATLGASGGTGGVVWSLDSGALPAGITLNASGSLAGRSSALGTFTFGAKATDAGWPANIASKTLTLSVNASEVVLYAADAAVVSGAWARIADATAAGGVRLSNVDRAAAKIATALAAPANYFEMTFEAQAGVAYHLWMRGKADKNSWANDSVYVQFSGSVNAIGAPLYGIGTTSATVYSVEDGTNAGVAGWGWNDDAYAGLAAPLYFAKSGPQTIRVQVREDGLSLDQIVLSSGAYLATSPGAFKNDTTILPR